MKKLITIMFVGTVALALAAPIASACPSHDDSKVVNKEKKQDGDKGSVAGKDKKDQPAKTEKKEPDKVSKK